MSLLDCTKKILEVTEQISGRPVRVQEDPTLTVLATIKIARGNAPMHLISYRPIPGKQPDYHICYQCAFVIRLFETPPEARFDFGPSAEAPAKMDFLLRGSSVPPQLKEMLMNGLLTQLRSVPVGLRVDDWLMSTCPDLLDQQIASCRLQLKDNAQALSPNVRKSFPKKLVNANTAMNAAYALFWAAKLNDQSISLPYRSIGADADGKALLDILSGISSKPTSDREAVDRWAEQLGLRGWYEWNPYKLED